jgi:hypothetical protein
MNPAEWVRCRPWLVPALREDTEAHVVGELLANRAQLWPGKACAFVTQLCRDDEPYILVWLAGGDLRELLTMQPGMEAWARAQGCVSAWINGRRGWARALRKTGFEPHGDGELRKVL